MTNSPDWKYRIPEYGDTEFTPIPFRTSWRRNAIYGHEDAAEIVAQNLTSDDPDYYAILEDQGMEVEIMSPEGHVKAMRISGHPSFVYSAEEVS